VSKLSSQQWRSPRKMLGFTLIELMITVAVIAVLASIAYPSYTAQVRKSKRAAAKAELVEYAQRAERQHTLNNSYTNFKFVENSGTTIASPRWQQADVPGDLCVGQCQRVYDYGSSAG